MLYAFQPLLCLKLCQHNQLRLTAQAFLAKSPMQLIDFLSSEITEINLKSEKITSDFNEIK